MPFIVSCALASTCTVISLTGPMYVEIPKYLLRQLFVVNEI